MWFWIRPTITPPPLLGYEWPTRFLFYKKVSHAPSTIRGHSQRTSGWTPGEGGLQIPDVQLLFECDYIVLSGRRGELGVEILVLVGRLLSMAPNVEISRVLRSRFKTNLRNCALYNLHDLKIVYSVNFKESYFLISHLLIFIHTPVIHFHVTKKCHNEAPNYVSSRVWPTCNPRWWRGRSEYDVWTKWER